MTISTVKVLRSGEGPRGVLGGMGIRFMIPGTDSGGGFALVEHPLAPRTLAAPLHRHSREDEYSIVVSGTVGVLLGHSVVVGSPGDVIYKPRGQWHTFWNAGDEPASVLEIISPAGFEKYFEELIAFFTKNQPDPAQIVPIAARYGLELDLSTIPDLCGRYGLRFG